MSRTAPIIFISDQRNSILPQLTEYVSKFLRVPIRTFTVAPDGEKLSAKDAREHTTALWATIAAQEPRALVLLGKGATFPFSSDMPPQVRKVQKWEKVVGVPFSMRDLPTIITYSASTLFSQKNGEAEGYLMLRSILEHVYRLVNPASHPPLTERQYQFIECGMTASSILRPLRGQIIGIDLETTGLNFQTEKIRTIQFSWADYQGITVAWEALPPTGWSRLLTQLSEHNTLVGANFKFDAKFLLRHGVRVPMWHELQVMHVIEDERPGTHNLNAISWQMNGEGKADIDITTLTTGDVRDTVAYATADVDLTRRASLKLLPVCERPIFDIMRRASYQLARAEHHGILVNQELLSDLESRAETALRTYDEIFASFGVRGPNDRIAIARTLGVAGSVDKAALELIDHPLAEAVIDARSLVKAKGSYLDRIRAGIQFDGRYHADFRLAGPATGRTSCGSGSVDPGEEWQSINMQNIPRPGQTGAELARPSRQIMAQLRNLFVADPGHVILGADLSNAELRVALGLAQSRQGIIDMNNKLDTHSLIAAMAFGLPQDLLDINDPETYKPFKTFISENFDAQRTAAKAETFAALYGAARTASNGHIQDAIYTRYPELRAYFDDIHRQAKAGTVKTRYGRVRRFPYATGVFGRDIMEAMLRQAQNYVIQSTASDYCLKSLCDFAESAPLATPLLFVHDANYFLVPEDKADEYKTRLVDCMQSADDINGVVIYADAKYSTSWGSM